MKTRVKAIAWTNGWFFTPFLAPLMQNRPIIGTLAVMTALQVGLTAAGLPAWRCPLNATLGVPGPGCGLTRAMVLLIQGHWQASFHMHAFAPIFLIGVMVLTIISITPKKFQEKATRWTTEFEKRTGVATVLMTALLTYWIFRIIYHL